MLKVGFIKLALRLRLAFCEVVPEPKVGLETGTWYEMLEVLGMDDSDGEGEPDLSFPVSGLMLELRAGT